MKTRNQSQQRKQHAKSANANAVSDTVRRDMARKILALNEKHGYTFAQISEAMGRTGGYSHLVLDGSRCKPTKSDERGLNGMWYVVTLGQQRTRNETERKIKVTGLLSEAMRIVSEEL